MSKKSSFFQQKDENLMEWVGFWRKNPHIFAKDYLGISLHLYQKILFYMMNKVDFFMYIAARGQGKSYLIALYCIIRCILYPSTKIVLASGTKGQAANIITQKIMTFYNDSEAVRFEIGDVKNISTSANEPKVTFKNGSMIMAATSSDSARGLRCNILIVDEFRLVKKDALEKILKPMLNVYRQPPYVFLPEYKDLPREENKEIYISSAWYKTHWIWDEVKNYVNKMLNDNEDYFIAILPYQLSVLHGLLSKSKVLNNKSSDNFDKTGFDMEYEAIFIGENDKAYFKLDKLNKTRTVSKTFIPPTDLEYIENKSLTHPKKLGNMPRAKDVEEIRLIALDIALMGGNKNVKNDTSAFTLMRLFRDGESYRREVVYLESINESITSQGLAIRLKQLYYDFEADYVVMDANGNGIGVFDACASVLHDEIRDIDYPAWSSMNDEATNERTKTKGMPVVYTVKASASFNHEIATSLNSVIENGKLRLPMNHIEKREELVTSGGFVSKSPEEQQRELYAFQQATALVNELINLEYDIRDGGKIRIREVGTTTKDRYSSIAYCNYYANELEKQLRDEEASKNFLDFLFV